MAKENSGRIVVPPKSALHFLLTEDYLVAANHGRPFTRDGLRIACRVQKSSKDQSNSKPVKSQQAGKAYMEEIWRAWIEEYQKKQDAPARHAAAEREIGEELFRYLLREFMKNANDANTDESFGGKGFGLRTILPLCNNPRIYSGSLSFCFDRHLSQQALAKGLGKLNLTDTPLLRLPFPAPRSKEPKRIQDMMKDYDTAFVLPFRTKMIRTEFVTQWDRLIDDAMMLLYLPGLDHVIWERMDELEKTKRTWVRDQNKNSVRIIDEGKRTKPARIRLRPPPNMH